ncbi:M48 family metallopeptidase [Pseudomonas sp. TTU2014-080ASC]|uniref:M48 family metallopeptidase n=1 Tax=Pseudomonas sp. TTU2014-080ASC TaxID=1729724 RepID=UPI000718855F|nr:M48 family metallopeptidase [Pseudomonas sp. TTU2014-080ASC]KRW58862.1 hypothetical protein AO726_15220 [Pseudomonas sp. TTU2014-080ASC]
MNFFEHQAQAQRNSGLLLVLMVLAVVSLIAITSLLLGMIWNLRDTGQTQSLPGHMDWLPSWELIGVVSLAIITVVLGGSLGKWVELRKGGSVIAERLGGRLINLSPQSFEERRLLNVVEEMALASGSPVPPVYVLDDSSINAFAAGLTPQDAVIGVTQGAISHLSREELQGVIAHEFSHIFHGDMRLNTRLVAVLNGILLMGLIGSLLVRSIGRSRSSGRNRSKDNLVALLMLTGVTLWVTGAAGTFFGNLIKAAVSRQREYLADASAVQFTRNPQSIAGALKKIGGSARGSQLHSGYAAEFSHMFFAAGVRQTLLGLHATHPPLEKRIRRITPEWDGSFPPVTVNPPLTPKSWAAEEAAFAGFRAQSALDAIDAVGEPTPQHLEVAQQVLERIDVALKEAAHRCIGAQAIVFGLLLDQRPEYARAQLQSLQGVSAAEVFEELQGLKNALLRLPSGLRLPLLDLSLPALKLMSREQYAAFKESVKSLIIADGRVALSEWALLRIVERNVMNQRQPYSRYRLSQLADEVSIVLTLMSRTGAATEQDAQLAFDKGCTEVGLTSLRMRAVTETSLRALEQSLERLCQLKPLQKPRLLKALVRCIEHDGQIEPLEAELFRAVADILDCPMPPLLADSR